MAQMAGLQATMRSRAVLRQRYHGQNADHHKPNHHQQKTYDGNNNISVSAGTLSGFVGSETVTATASGTTSDANAGSGKSVSISYTLADGTNGELASNYALADGTGNVDITRKTLTMTNLSAANKTYDGATSASVTTSGLTGFVGSETVTASATGQFSDANAGSGKSVSVSYTLADGCKMAALQVTTALQMVQPQLISLLYHYRSLAPSATSRAYDGSNNSKRNGRHIIRLNRLQTVTVTPTGNL